MEAMKNILSYVRKPLTGSEIKAWIVEHTKRQTEYTRIARSMMRYMNLQDEELYEIVLAPSGTGVGEQKRYKPNVIKVNGREV